MLAEDLLVVMRAVLAAPVAVEDAVCGWHSQGMAIFSARIARSRFMRLLTAQPITRREWRSRITARYSHPSRVQM